MNYLCTTEAELGIDLDRPLSEQDPLDRLNDLENKKRKHADDIHSSELTKGLSHQFNIKIIQLNKFEGDNTPVVIQPPCYSASKILRDQHKVKLALLSSEEVSSNDKEMVEVKVLMTLADDESVDVGKKSGRNDTSSSGKKDLVFIKSSSDDSNVPKLNVERPWFSKAKDSVEESTLVCSTPLPLLEKLPGTKPQTRPKTIKSILKSCSTRKVETLKGVIISESNTSSAPTKGNKNILISKKHSAFTRKLKDAKTKDEIPMYVVMKELKDLKLQISKSQ
ncbi:hypothetical protein Tco_0931988 [Tanacetum coccineum]